LEPITNRFSFANIDHACPFLFAILTWRNHFCKQLKYIDFGNHLIDWLKNKNKNKTKKEIWLVIKFSFAETTGGTVFTSTEKVRPINSNTWHTYRIYLDG